MIENDIIVSVIIPTYNRANLIGRSIQSVLSQNYQKFEIIVVDDGSSDNTEELIEDIKLKDKRIRYIRHEKNKGPSAARNTGIKYANGEYIAFQDSDDEWLPDKLKKQVDLIVASPGEVGVVYTDMWRVNGRDKRYFHSPHITPQDKIFYWKALDNGIMNIGIGTVLVRKIFFDKAGLFDEKLRGYEDYEMFIRLSKYCYFNHIPEPLVKYYSEDEGVSSSVKNLIAAQKFILDKYFHDIHADNSTLAKHYLRISTNLFIDNEEKEGGEYLAKALVVCPNMIKDRKTFAEYYYNIGSRLCLSGDFINSRKYFIKSIKTQPLSIKGLLAMLLTFFSQDNYRMVRKYFNRMLSIKYVFISRF